MCLIHLYLVLSNNNNHDINDEFEYQLIKLSIVKISFKF